MKNLFISYKSNIRDAYQKLNLSGKRCLFVVNSKNEFLGMLTDGDIRKAILKKNIDLTTLIRKIYNKKPYFVIKDKYDLPKIKKFIIKEQYLLVPIIKNKKVVDYFSFAKIIKKESLISVKKHKISIPLVIMAGGKGTRLKPFSNVLPKALLPINEKTVVENIIDRFMNYGINDIYLTINHKSSLVKSYFNELKNSFLIKFLEEKKELGTAGSLSLLDTKKIKKDIFLINCDIIIDTDYYEILKHHKTHNNDLTLVVCSKEFQIPYGTCEIRNNGKLIKLIEKPSNYYLLNCGMYILNKKIINLISKNTKIDFNDLIDLSIKKKYNVGVYPISEESWNDIGLLKNYSKFIEHI